MPRFHAEVTRRGAGWLIYVKELNESVVAENHREVVDRIQDLIASNNGLSHDQIDLMVHRNVTT